MSPASHPFSMFRLPLNGCRICVSAVLSLTLSLASVVRASDSPGESLRRQFESAKASLASGDLAHAENSYRQAIALGLRQLGNLSMSEDQFARATRLLD